MKKVIVTKHSNKELTDLTFPKMEEYAKKIGADFRVIRSEHLCYFLLKYDRVCYIEPQLLIRPESPSIFDEVPTDKIGIFNEASSNPEAKQEKFYNSGVIILSRSHVEAFKGIKMELLHDKQYLSIYLMEKETEIHELDYKFNRIPLLDFKTGEARFKSWFLNYENVDDYKIIEKDIETIEKFPATHPWKRKIWVKIGGGLGDAVMAEPTLRFMCEKIYPDEDIRISSHWPELFTHLPLKSCKYGDSVWADADGAPWVIESMPDSKHFQWRVVSCILSHTIDFTSMAILRRTLPNIDKQIKLDFPHSDLKKVHELCGTRDFSNCVLVHAGKHWNSKSFPDTYWQAIIDGIEEKGLTPILIGRNCKSTIDTGKSGVWQGSANVTTKNGINLIDKTTLSQLIALISCVPCLLSNDSSPVHIAGAFDHQIILLPSCKHPDHLLPYRQGHQSHKTTVLYKKLTLDDIPSAPTEMYTVLADEIVGEWDEYLLDVDDVIESVYKIMMSL